MSDRRKLSTLSLLSLFVLIALIGFGGYQYVMAMPETTEDEEFGERVRAYLLSNPQVLREVITELNRQEKLAEVSERKGLLAALDADLKKDGYSFVAGNPDGDVTIVEFFDYRCGYCKQSFATVMETVEKDGNIRLVLKEFPILSEESFLAAQAAIAAIEQGKYMELHSALMTARGDLTMERILAMAADVGLDVETLQADMKSDKTREIVEKNHALAKMLGISGTPAFVIGNEFIPGAISGEQMQQLVAAAREKPAETAADTDS